MAMEFLLVISMLLVVFLLMLQYAVKAHAQRIITAAAQEGLAVTASYEGTTTAGQRTANDYLTRLGPGLRSSHVVATRTGNAATITITGEVTQLIPFLGVSVEVHTEGPIEHFVRTPPGEGR
jgi:hypothetical protein